MKVSWYNERRSPCYDCTTRCAGCHATCAAYGAYKARLAELNKEKNANIALAQMDAERRQNAARNQRNARRRRYAKEG